MKIDKNNLDGLLALKLIAEKNNFTIAAEILDISPSAISQTIRQLEKKLGVVLLNRTTRSVTLTEVGKKFIQQIEPALDQILNAINDIEDLSNKPSGLLRISLQRFVYQSMLAPTLKGFFKKYPEIKLELYFEDSTSDMVAKGFDAGIRLSEILEKDMVGVKLSKSEKFVVAGSPSYFKQFGRPKHPKELINHTCIIPRLEPELYDRWEFEYRGKEFKVHVEGSLIVNDSILLTEMASDGLGLIYTIESRISDLVKEKKLEIILHEFGAHSPGFYLYFPKQSQVSPKLRAFIDYLKETL